MVFDAQTRKLVSAIPMKGQGDIFTAIFSPDSSLLATGSYGKLVTLWSTTTWQQVHALQGHEHGIRRVAFSPDGKLLASASWDRDVRLWDVESGKSVATLRGHLDQACAIAFSPDGALLASGGWDGMVRLWNVQSHQELGRFVSDEGRVWSLAFSPDGKSLYYGGLRLHRLQFDPLPSPGIALEKALKAGEYRLEGPNLVR
jgi:WD40 repeat protein